jgi:hypothetical protein
MKRHFGAVLQIKTPFTPSHTPANKSKLAYLCFAMFAFVAGFANDRLHEVSSAACHTASAVTAPIAGTISAAVGAAGAVYDAVQAITATAGLAEPATLPASAPLVVASPNNPQASPREGLHSAVPGQLLPSAALVAEVSSETPDSTAPVTPAAGAQLPSQHSRLPLRFAPLPLLPPAIDIVAPTAALTAAVPTAVPRKSVSPLRASPIAAVSRRSRTPVSHSR